jgi:hypothetical protein
MSARIFAVAALLVLTSIHARAQDTATYTLTPAAAERFVRATQQLAASGAAPNLQGGANPFDLTPLKAALDGTPAAGQALVGAGLSSSEYVAFMGAAMAAMMVGQMEAAGMRGMLPPGVTARPSQQNIDFMIANPDLFARAMQPGAPAAASASRAGAAEDEALPMPAAIGAVLPSSILARLTSLDEITDGTDCTLGDAAAAVASEMNKVRAQQGDYYGNPGDRGLARTAAEGAVLERTSDSTLMICGLEESNGVASATALAAADAARRERAGRIAAEQEKAWNACPGIPGGKEPACEQAVERDAARRLHDSERQFLAATAPLFARRLAVVKECTAQREALLRDARAADVRGANVLDVLQVLSVAWERAQPLPLEWQGICENAQRALIE